MRTRILLAIIGVTTVAVVGFGIPLAIVVAHMYHDQAIAELQRDATATAAETSAPPSPNDTPELPHDTGGARIGVYDPTGRRIAGTGPDPADDVTRSGTAGPITEKDIGGSIVVALPVGSDENVTAVVRAALPLSVVDARVHRAWRAMAALGLVVIGGATLVALWQARRLSRPVAHLADAATRLGQRDFTVRNDRTGIVEVDAVATALDNTAQQLGDLVERERAFSAHASHQLRTPLAGLRIQLEGAAQGSDVDLRPALQGALDSVERLQQTIDDLLALSRDIRPSHSPLDVCALFDEIDHRWHGPLVAEGRRLRTEIEPDLLPTTAAAAAVRQVLEVLVANATEHGAGIVTVGARDAGGAVAIEVTDEGRGIAEDAPDVFTPRARTDSHRGIGLGLARTLAAAEGGRLMLDHRGPSPTFRLLLPALSDGGRP
jgi:signal transduction histidine kinase